ncbi:hypothetical protein QVD17_13651 [Tagetes erecta]|uniref:Uncharacterized protein n=1 Tax=Tagetes erecta TaxID=13708 RepID=A0AAD8NWA1_TARER|nr:hypothetical protein QVD17_13651 [Tagetes erecta]
MHCSYNAESLTNNIPHNTSVNGLSFMFVTWTMDYDVSISRYKDTQACQRTRIIELQEGKTIVFCDMWLRYTTPSLSSLPT